MSLQTTPGLSVLGTLEGGTRDYEAIHFENQQEMAIRRNDLAVFEFIASMTKCKEGTTGGGYPSDAGDGAGAGARMLRCRRRG